LQELQQNLQETGQKDVLSVKEAADYMGLSVGTIHRLTSQRRLPFYKPGGKIAYLKLSDIQAYMFRNRVASRDEIEGAAAAHLLMGKHSKKKGK
jgi:excisionase family DNA binding protein